MKIKNQVLVIVFLVLILVSGAYAEDWFLLPPDLTVIEREAFQGVSIRNLFLPPNLTTIGSKAFAYTGLETVLIPRSVQYIAADAFEGCGSLLPYVYEDSYADRWCANNSITAMHIISLDVDSHTQQDIRDFVNSHPAETDSDTTFRREPTVNPYSPGLISSASLQNGINMLNQVRFIAGLNANVVNNPDWEEMLGATSLVNALNGFLSHSPGRPAALADSSYDDLYNLGYKGASQSNLYAGIWNLADSILGYMYDSDSGNIPMVGHRRWILNPGMGKTTFGYFYHQNVGSWPFSGLYAFDQSGSGSQMRIAWPGQQTPISHFYNSSSHAWSVSFSQNIDISKVRVMLIRHSDGEIWRFRQGQSDGDLYVNNDGYGRKGCVIFRPSGIGTISAGDSFTVCIENSGNDTVLIYTVTFFDL